MIKFLHSADVHLGAKFKYLGEKASQHREQLKKTFSNIVNLAVNEKIDILLIAGDLFDSNTVSSSIIDFVKTQFKILKENSIRVCVLPGTHDALSRNSVYLRENFSGDFDNVYVFIKEESYEYPDIDLTVWGKSNKYPKSDETPIIKKENSRTKHNILIAHGSIQIEGKSAKDDYPIEFNQIKDCGMDYVALGHWHSMGDYSQGGVKCFYSGSPEVIDIGQKGAGSVLIGEIKDKGDIVVTPAKVGSKNIVELEIDLGSVENEDDLKKKILNEAGDETIKIIELKGLVKPDFIVDAKQLEQELGENYFRLKIINNSHIGLDLIDEKNYPEELVAGKFVALMKKKIAESKNDAEKKKLEQALNLGLAELGGKDVL